ncbi:hypothetical protein [Brucella intermedia]|uniref:hypothetical protein n=1 Tax=Brucella intermedia TaxID=94625 RepID=UPI00124D8898|nr:hypothetical protein [Brucella intermedia]KAB2725414.1 hypothetical protein F9L02_19525 [Brucella intermedia]
MKHTDIVRGGVTARKHNVETSGLHAMKFTDNGEDKLLIGFSIASKGGGTTVLSVRIGPGDFEQLISLMMKTSRESTLKAVGNVLVKHAAG